MTKFFFTLKKPYFWLIFGPLPLFLGAKKCFPKKSGMHNLIRFSSTMPEIQRNLMIQFQENNPTNSRMERWIDPISWDPSGYCYRSNKYNCSRLRFNSQRYRV